MAAKKRPRARRAYGSGSTYQTKAGTWYAQARIDGKLVRRRAANEQAAQTALAELQTLKVKKIDLASGGQSVTIWLEACLAERVRLRHPKLSTVENERGTIERYILPIIGGMALLSIRPPHLQRVIDATYDGIQADGRYDGARSAHAVATILSRVFSLAAARKLIPENPYAGIELPAYQPAPIAALEDDHLLALLRAVRGDRLLGLWWSYALLGLRRGEGLGLRWMAYDSAAQTIRIDQQVQQIGGALVFGTPKTPQSIRLLPLPRRLAALFERQRAALQGERAAWADRCRADPELPAWDASGLIFPGRGGAPLWPSAWGEHFRRVRRRAGLPATVKPHHLRHTLSTNLDECGATEALKAGILGHVKESQTQKYTHARVAAMRTVLQAVEDRLFGAVEEVEKERAG